MKEQAYGLSTKLNTTVKYGSDKVIKLLRLNWHRT